VANGSNSITPRQENRLVTKKDIAKAIADELGLTILQAKQITDKVFDSIVNTLVEDGRVELRNFGVFAVRWRKARVARNPRTGAKVMVPAKCTVVFQPGLMMEQRVVMERPGSSMPAEGLVAGE
jgi:nucleoid DNA-binding protein